MKKVLIRTDSGRHIGHGHMIRCLNLARELSKLDVEVIFCCKNHQADISHTIVDEFERLLLPQGNTYLHSDGDYPHSHWLGSSELQDAEQVIYAIEQRNFIPHIIIVDHFALGKKWEQKLAKFTQAKIIVIDGLKDRPHECDVLIDPTLTKPNSISNVKRLLSGPDLLPPATNFRQFPIKYRHNIQTILVCFGGVDHQNLTLKICELLIQPTLKKHIQSITVIVTDLYPYMKSLQGLCYQHSNYLNLKVQSKKIAQHMFNADLAIGAGGMMAWERCILALPTICFTVADNQWKQNMQLAERCAILHLGRYSKETPLCFTDTLKRLIADPKKLNKMSINAAKLMVNWPKRSKWLQTFVNNGAL